MAFSAESQQAQIKLLHDVLNFSTTGLIQKSLNNLRHGGQEQWSTTLQDDFVSISGLPTDILRELQAIADVQDNFSLDAEALKQRDAIKTQVASYIRTNAVAQRRSSRRNNGQAEQNIVRALQAYGARFQYEAPAQIQNTRRAAERSVDASAPASRTVGQQLGSVVRSFTNATGITTPTVPPIVAQVQDIVNQLEAAQEIAPDEATKGWTLGRVVKAGLLGFGAIGAGLALFARYTIGLIAPPVARAADWVTENYVYQAAALGLELNYGDNAQTIINNISAIEIDDAVIGAVSEAANGGGPLQEQAQRLNQNIPLIQAFQNGRMSLGTARAATAMLSGETPVPSEGRVPVPSARAAADDSEQSQVRSSMFTPGAQANRSRSGPVLTSAAAPVAAVLNSTRPKPGNGTNP